ncbi:auxin-responsive protein IAA12-like [Bidens hawaiensis]|uniref:auxin-responsive protein IAA12-like n=1 Tax=Bidens hawaiensis TaxID=980011 RepID=UPI0040494FFD
MSNNKANNNNHNMSTKDDDDDLELVLGLSIGGSGLKPKEEASRMILASQDLHNLKPSCSSSSSSSSVNIPTSSIDGIKRTCVQSVSPPNATSVIGWPPIRKAHRAPMANRTKSEHEEFSSRPKTENITNGHHLTVKVNMDGTLIGRKVDLYAHSSYETLAQTLENMFYGRCSSRLLNETSEFVLTYEDKDGDCMLVGDVPWQMFLSSVKRLRILRNPKMQH